MASLVLHKNLSVLYLIGFHILLGFMASVYRPIIMLYFFLAIVFFVYRILNGRNKDVEVLIAASYMGGAEVFFRMTKALIFYESGKYIVIFFFLIGMLFRGFKNNAFPYAIYLFLLIPGIFIAYANIEYDDLFRQMILFNLSGPICLSIAAIFCFNRTVKFKDMLSILNVIVYPLIAMVIYIYLYNPDVREVITGTVSTSATSGGYGPNQVATVLGLGFFILFVRLLIPYKNKLVHFLMMGFLVFMGYRALITFSRGGVITAALMCIVFVFIFYRSTSFNIKIRTTRRLIFLSLGGIAIWFYALLQTRGLIENRYTNKDALGREKEDFTTGRIDLIKADFEAFKDEPITGIGVGQVKGFYQERLNINLASHNEIARMFSEHGSLGIIALTILVVTPWISVLQGRRNLFFVPFLLFWLLTIGHSSMRIAAPALIYGLALLNIDYAKEKS